MINYFNKAITILLKPIFLWCCIIYAASVLAVGQYVEENFSAKDRPSIKSVDYSGQTYLPSLADIQAYCGYNVAGKGPVIYAKAYHGVTTGGVHFAGIKCFSDYYTPGFVMSPADNCPACSCTTGSSSPVPGGYSSMEYRCAAVKAEVLAILNSSAQCDIIINGNLNTTGGKVAGCIRQPSGNYQCWALNGNGSGQCFYNEFDQYGVDIDGVPYKGYDSTTCNVCEKYYTLDADLRCKTPSECVCSAGTGNCDGSWANGCETNLNNDFNNCGACTSKCGPGEICTGGKCTATCGDGIKSFSEQCDDGNLNNLDGCSSSCTIEPSKNITVVPNNNRCEINMDGIFTGNYGNAIAGCEPAKGDGSRRCWGVHGKDNCWYTTYNQFGGDIDGTPGMQQLTPVTCDVCSIYSSFDTAADKRCKAQNTCCSDTECIAPNNATTTCNTAYGVCDFQCAGGFANCNGDWVNGCEVNLNIDTNNCGACGNVCPSGQSCSSGNCIVPPPNCTAPEIDCSGACKDLSTDINNCGSCGNACSVGQSCSSGSCLSPPPVTNCGNGYLDTGEVCDSGAGNATTNLQGCAAGCASVITGWECTGFDNATGAVYTQSTQQTNFDISVARASSLFTELSAYQAAYDTNNCNTIGSANEQSCIDYQTKVNEFKDLNFKIPADCSSAGGSASFKQRPNVDGGANYSVKCQ